MQEAATLLQITVNNYALKGKGLQSRDFLAKQHQRLFLTMLQQLSKDLLEELKLPCNEYLIRRSLKSLATSIEMVGHAFLGFFAWWFGCYSHFTASLPLAVFPQYRQLLEYLGSGNRVGIHAAVHGHLQIDPGYPANGTVSG